jgi:hypothetical protein
MKELKTMYMPVPRQYIIDRRSPLIVEVQCYEHDMDRNWVEPRTGRVLMEGHHIFNTYEEARAYQNAVINSMIMQLRVRQDKLNDIYGDQNDGKI